MRALRLFGIIAVLWLVADTARAESHLAFVVGNDAYRNVNPLLKAVNDSRAVGRSLQQLGFRVTLGENLAWRDFVEKFSIFENSIQPGDVAFLFYSGHGVEIDGANYLIPIDAPKVAPEQQSLLKDVSISTDNLIQRLKARGARTQIVVLDACRENPFRQAGGRSVGGARGLAGARLPGGVFMIYSAGVGEVALDRLSDNDANPNSIFTRSFLPLLENPDNSLIQVAKQTRTAVKSLAASIGQTQSPAYYDELDGEIFLAKGSVSSPITPVPQTLPVVTTPPAVRSDFPPPPPAQSNFSRDFIFPDSDRIRLTRDMLVGLSAAQLRVARNEIYARRGRYFKDPMLAQYFSRFSWYRPYTWDVPLNGIEQANVALIASFER
ncbi:MAG: caspase family protein [Bradyrhizobium sp.]|uniref:caspase family protein n=1 Tax=Bradyrhizobium sp. TaxID=376 RepID=UPI0025C3AC91|nr:caspase family protein [Bradyrhizobium sp.]MBI5261999.1 caspase family protein [Bradyrhizobium sp.]